MTAALPALARGKPVEVWWQDEARVGQQGTLSRVWAPRGSRPPASRDQRHASTYLFGAVRPARGVGAGLVLPAADTAAVARHLVEISARVAPGAHAVVVLDGAAWHRPGSRLPVPDNITLLHLPPCSPELSPVENVWAWLRGNKLSNRVYEGCDAGTASPPRPSASAPSPHDLEHRSADDAAGHGAGSGRVAKAVALQPYCLTISPSAHAAFRTKGCGMDGRMSADADVARRRRAEGSADVSMSTSEPCKRLFLYAIG